MSVTSLLELIQLTETQSEKMTVLNTLVSQLENVVAGTYTLTTTAGSDQFTLPYDDSSDLSDRTALRFIRLVCTDDADRDFQVIHPRAAHLFFVRNDSDFVATFDAGGDTVNVQPQTGQIVYCDGTDFYLLLTDTRQTAADFHFQYWGKPGASEIMGEIMPARATTILNNMAGSVARVGTDPTGSSVVIDVLDNSTKFGEITITTGGNVSFNHTVSGNRIISAGDRLVLRAPATENAAFEDFQVTIPATAFL